LEASVPISEVDFASRAELMVCNPFETSHLEDHYGDEKMTGTRMWGGWKCYGIASNGNGAKFCDCATEVSLKKQSMSVINMDTQ